MVWEKKLSEISISERMLDDKKGQLEKSKILVETRKEKISQIRREIAETEMLIREGEEKIPKGFKEKMKKLDSDIINLEKQKAVIEREIKSLEEKEKSAVVSKKLYENTEKSLAELREKKEKLELLVGKKQDIENKYQEALHSIQEMQSIRAVIIDESKTARDILSNIKDMKKCPKCRQDITEAHRIRLENDEREKLRRNEEKLKKIDDELLAINKKMLSAKEELESIRKAELDKNTLDANILNLEKRMVELKQEPSIEDIEKQKSQAIELLKSSTGILEKTIEERKSLEGIKKIDDELNKSRISLAASRSLLVAEEKEIKTLENNIRQLSSEISALDEKIKDKENVQKELARLNSELESIEAGYLENTKVHASLQTEAKMLETEITLLSNELKELDIKKKKLDEIREVSNWIDTVFLSIIDNIEKHVLISVYSEFNELFQEWFSMLIDNESMNARLDETFSPVIEQNASEIPVEHISGGEKTACALAYRLALNTVINDIISTIKTKDIIMLDEPTEGFSSEQLDKIREILDQLDMKQVIIVSHEPKIESFVQNIIKVSKNENGSVVE